MTSAGVYTSAPHKQGTRAELRIRLAVLGPGLALAPFSFVSLLPLHWDHRFTLSHCLRLPVWLGFDGTGAHR